MDIKKIERRHFLKSCASGIGTLTVSSIFPKKLYPKDTYNHLKIGYLPITDATPLLIAHAQGYFEEEGLKVERPTLIRSWSALSESFITGKFNLTHMLFPIPIWMRYKNNIPIKVLAWDHTNGSALTVGKNSGIKNFSDLGGKQIAVPYWYSMHNIILQAGIKKVKLKPVIKNQAEKLLPDEVNLFILPPPEMPPALAGRKIDGYIVAEPFNAIGEMKIKARIMRFTGDIWKNHPCCVVVMQENITKNHPVFTQKVTNAIVRAQLYAKNNPLAVAHMLSREGKRYLPVSYATLKKVFTQYDPDVYGSSKENGAIQHPDWGVGRIGFQPYPYPSATKFLIEEMATTRMEGDTNFVKKLDPDFAVTDLVDDSFVKKAIHLVGGLQKFYPEMTSDLWKREEIIDL